ncbi:MAG: sialidase family protein [Bryobacteraceae bacterium]
MRFSFAALTSALFAAAAFAQMQKAVVLSGQGYFPVTIKLKNGDLLTVLRGGAPHVGKKGRLDLIRSTDGGKTWSAPWTAVDEAEDDRNPAMGQMPDGSIVLAYVILSGFDESGLRLSRNRAERKFDGVYLVRSTDNGKTWSKPVRDPGTFDFYKLDGAISPYGKIIQLKDGSSMMAVYFEFHDQRGNESYAFRSRDGGKTWGEPVSLGKHYNETGIVALRDGTVIAALRSEKGGHVAITRSADGGKTWSEPVQVTKDNEHPADLIQLANGNVLMTYGERNPPRGAHARISKDGGKTWGEPIVLGDQSPNTDCGYPSSVEVSKGRIVTIYYQVDDLKNAPASSKANSVIWRVPK